MVCQCVIANFANLRSSQFSSVSIPLIIQQLTIGTAIAIRESVWPPRLQSAKAILKTRGDATELSCGSGHHYKRSL
jgi:hypothetical protein